MKFKIRNLNADDHSAVEVADSAYRSHLDRFVKSSNSDLWKYFYWDFFHDGRISEIAVGRDLKTVTITIDSPNIKRRLLDGNYEYECVTFQCTFCNVVRLAIENSPPGEWHPNVIHQCIFLASEINTLPLPRPVEGDEFYSLLIKALAGDARVWIKMIFSQVNVTATEPVAFALMEASDQFEIPVYQRDAARISK